jgi:hypothetical protein
MLAGDAGASQNEAPADVGKARAKIVVLGLDSASGSQ